MIQLQGTYAKELKTSSLGDISIPMFTAALLTMAKAWKQRSAQGQMNR